MTHRYAKYRGERSEGSKANITIVRHYFHSPEVHV